MGIIFYRREGDDRVVRLYPEKPVWEPKYLLDSAWERTIKAIDIMYELIKQRWPPEKIQDHLMVKSRIREFFNSNDLREQHPTPEALTAYCKRMLQAGYPPGEVEHYHRSYTEKYFSNNK